MSDLVTRPAAEVSASGRGAPPNTADFPIESNIAAPPAKETQPMIDYEALSLMSLESLLYYVLAGDGRGSEATAWLPAALV
jgi:hypothetical protein